MKNDTKGNTLVVILIIIVIGLLFLLVRKEGEDKVTVPTQTQTTPTEEQPTGKESAAIIAVGKANVNDLSEFTIIPGQSISGKNEVNGTLVNGYFFEGNIVVNIVDKNKILLRSGHGTATENWMTEGEVSFDAIVDVTGLPQGFAYIAIQNDNASGDPANDKIIYVPIVINND